MDDEEIVYCGEANENNCGCRNRDSGRWCGIWRMGFLLIDIYSKEVNFDDDLLGWQIGV